MILAALQQSALDPAGRQASIIHSLWWLFIWICAAVYLLVLLCLLISLLRRTTTPQMPPPNLAEDPQQQRRLTNLISGLIVLTTIILFVLLISDFVSGERVHALAKTADQIEIKVTAHQWWWDFDYQDPVRSQMVNTANEIHIPVGVPVQFDLNSADVIHSFWIPNLHGKKDMIPGHPTKVWLEADQAGTYYAQCAEFCGHQHAHMRFVVIAEDRYKYNQWLDDQRQPGRVQRRETRAN